MRWQNSTHLYTVGIVQMQVQQQQVANSHPQDPVDASLFQQGQNEGNNYQAEA